MKRLLILFILLPILKIHGQDSIPGAYESRRMGYFHAILLIFPDSTYAYSEWNHRQKKIQDQGRLIYMNSLFYLKSDLLKPTPKEKFIPTNKFQLVNINILPDKIIVLPCDSVFPEYCTFSRMKNTKKH
jgi:hypothetical protein